MTEEETKIPPRKAESAVELAEFCERIIYERKGENIIRLDMSAIETAQSDQYIICTGLSAPHIGAIAERIQREMRRVYALRPLIADGTPQSGWIILDFGSVMIHILTNEARDKYQLEELWGDAPSIDVAARLDEEHRKLAATKAN